MASFRLKNEVMIKGGCAGFGKPDPNARDIARHETILSGDIGVPDDNTDNSLHVVMAVNCDASMVLDGLTIPYGNASEPNNPDNRGGGVYDANSVSTLSNSILWANMAAQGPQIALANNATMTVQRCDVQDGQSNVYAVASTLNWGAGNIGSDPKFVDGDGPDDIPGTEDDLLGLLAGSPCIDAGDNKQVPPDAGDIDGDANTAERLPLDIAGKARFVDIPASPNTGVADPPAYPAIVDMGAYERGS